MSVPPRRRHVLARALLAVLAALYAWVATGVAPFTRPAYAMIALASLVVVVLYVRGESRVDLEVRGAAPVAPSSVAPWLVVLVLAVGLEGLGLALGGRSKGVPTLSTTLDHLLVTHALRAVLFLIWLGVAVAPLRLAHGAESH